MNYTSQQYAQALYDSLQETNPKDHDLVMDNFVKILAQNGELGRYEDIVAEYERIDMKARGAKQVEVTFAQEHNTRILNDLNAVVSGKTEFKTKIDSGIVGGVVLKVDDTLIDASVKTQLQNLEKDLYT